MPTLTINTTAAEIKQQVIEFLKDAVWQQEHREAVEAVNTTRINPT